MIKDIAGDNTRQLSFSVDDTQNVMWSIAESTPNNVHTGKYYFQRTNYTENGQTQDGSTYRSIYIRDLKAGDKVVVYPEPDKICICQNIRFSSTREFVMQSDGYLNITLYDQYSGIHKIELYVPEEEEPKPEPRFDYDPGYEEYDMYDEFSKNDPKKYVYDYNQGGVVELNPHQYSTSYTLSDEPTGITLNGNEAKFIVLSGSKNNGKQQNSH